MVNGDGSSSSGGVGDQMIVVTSLYVSNLEVNVSDSQLYDLFNALGPVASVRVCRDFYTRRSFGYAYVNYANPQHAARAIEELNYTLLNGKPIKIMLSVWDPNIPKTGKLFFKNLGDPIDQETLHEIFSSFGNIHSCNIATDSAGHSLGYGFVQYDCQESALKAIGTLNGNIVNDKNLYVAPFLSKREREMAVDSTKFTNVFVKNISESTKDYDLTPIFCEYGPITSIVLVRDGNGVSKCFGFVDFENAEDASRAVQALNGYKFHDKEWYVGKAQKKNEREQELIKQLMIEQNVKETVNKSQGLKLSINNLHVNNSEEDLKELFRRFGSITLCEIMRDPNGISKGSGFVTFSTSDEASRAILEMNGKVNISGKLLNVAVADGTATEDGRGSFQLHDEEIPFSNLATWEIEEQTRTQPPSRQQRYHEQPPPQPSPVFDAFGFMESIQGMFSQAVNELQGSIDAVRSDMYRLQQQFNMQFTQMQEQLAEANHQIAQARLQTQTILWAMENPEYVICQREDFVAPVVSHP